jgi:hypothetical protein
MSVLNTTALTSVPSAAAGNTITSDSTPWNNSSWVEFIASTSGITAIAAINNYSSNASGDVEIEFGTGTVGNEVAIGLWRVNYGNSGGIPASQHYEPPFPLGGIGSGVRVSIRVRYSAASAHNFTFKLGVYVTPSSDQVTAANEVYSCVPSAAAGVAVAANTTAWANTGYAELTSGLGGSTGWYGLCFDYPNTTIDGEWDIAIGGSGSEVVITTLRIAQTSTTSIGGMLASLLVAPYVIPANTRVAVRLRKSGVAAGTYDVSGLYITNLSASSGKGGGKGKGRGGGGVTLLSPEGATLVNYGNPGLNFLG